MSTKVIRLGKDWWRDERPAISGNDRVRVEREFKPIKDTMLLKPKKAAELMGLSYKQTLKKIREGKLRAQPMENGYRVPIEAIDEYLAELRHRKRVS